MDDVTAVGAWGRSKRRLATTRLVRGASVARTGEGDGRSMAMAGRESCWKACLLGCSLSHLLKQKPCLQGGGTGSLCGHSRVHGEGKALCMKSFAGLHKGNKRKHAEKERKARRSLGLFCLHEVRAGGP